MVRCSVFLRQKIKNPGTSDSLTENHAVENQARGHEPYGHNFTPNKQAVQMESRGGNTKCLRKSGLCFANRSISRAVGVSAKPTGSHDAVQRGRERSGHLGLWRMAATLLLPSQSASHHSVMLHPACSTEGAAPDPRKGCLRIPPHCQSCTVGLWVWQRPYQHWPAHSGEVFIAHIHRDRYPFA